MKLRILFLGSVALVMLALSAFVLPVTQAHAKQTVVTKHFTLHRQTLHDAVPTTVLDTTFSTNHPGVLSLRTIQKAMPGTVAIDVIIDGSIASSTIVDSGGSLNIFTTKYLLAGAHSLLVSYTSTDAVLVHSGKAILVIPFYCTPNE